MVFGEQPSASKWNQLGTNDASFNDGSGIAVDALADSKLVYGKLRNRQGGSATNWHVYGSNTYAYDATNVFFQVGYSAGGAGADSTVTFPTAFAQKPAVFLQVAGGAASSGDSVISENSYAIVTSTIATTGFTWRGINSAGTQTDQSVYWLAVGQ